MQPISTIYPVRLFIRHKAQRQILETLAVHGLKVDPQLFQDVANTVLQPHANPAIYHSHPSRTQAEAIEDQAAAAIASAYLRIYQRQGQAQVQQLNRLLNDG
ncbi:MAG: hypothetical protein HC922_09845 [Leptolyngbyaceae cyanobacterium SM2_3_12]|nr:hypothetical protein [Leptolyngbyaceae cyanobacterium SM2_3_12]